VSGGSAQLGISNRLPDSAGPMHASARTNATSGRCTLLKSIEAATALLGIILIAIESL
jgi:hypothetical protein